MAKFNWSRAVSAGAGVAGDYLLQDQITKDKNEYEINKAKAIAEYADQLSVRKDEREWKNEQDRAPTKNQMAIDAEIGKATAKLDFTTDPKNVEKVAKAKALESQLGEPERLRAAEAAAIAEAKIAVKLASDPAYIQSIRTMTSAKETAESRARAGLVAQQTVLEQIKAESAQELQNARTALAEATSPEEERAAKARVLAATFNASDERAYVTSLATMVKSADTLISNLEGRLNTARRDGAEDNELARLTRELSESRGSRKGLFEAYQKAVGVEVKAPELTPPPVGTVREFDGKKYEFAGGKNIAANWKPVESGVIDTGPPPTPAQKIPEGLMNSIPK